jgi:hypothetical protein
MTRKMKTLESLLAWAVLLMFTVSCHNEDAATQPSQAEQAQVGAWETVVDGTSFASTSAFTAKWNYLYPWGSDHNGSARMRSSNMSFSGSVLTITATPTSGVGNSSHDPYLPIRYYAGACHLKTHINVTTQFPNYEVKVDAQVPTARGTWPAFWLTGANGWPPESDIMEFKGNANCWQNTYTGSWQSKQTAVSSAGNWHTYRAWIQKVSDTDITIDYYIDGVWTTRHRANFVNKPMWLIINLQMEGSSGQPGPTGNTTYRTRNVYVGRSRV